jgi:serine/threonine protein phosphatase PrpC
MRAVSVGASHTGCHRENNEDRHLIDDQLQLYVVADGMGGHAAGEVAAELAIETAQAAIADKREQLARVAASQEPPETLLALVEDAVRQASAEVYRVASTDEDRAGMGCTLTLLLVNGSKAALAHVGDSRLYLLRDGGLAQLSSDHTMAAELVRAGAISAEQVAKTRYAHVLTRSIGAQPSVQVDTLLIDLLVGDRFLLCTDGLVGTVGVDRERLADSLRGDLDDRAEALLRQATEADAQDNVTALLVDVVAGDDDKQAEIAIGSQLRVRLDRLASVFLFEGLALASLQRLLHCCRMREIAAGEVVVAEGEACSALRVVLEGQLTLMRGQHTLLTLGAGESVGHACLVAPRKARATLRAGEGAPTQLLELPRDHFDRLLRARPWLGLELLERLGRWLSNQLDDALERAELHLSAESLL